MLTRLRRSAVAVTALAVGVCAAPTPAAGSPALGAYKASGSLSFRFALRHGYCYLPPRPVTNPKAHRGKGGTGICFGSTSTAVPIRLTCTQGASLRGETVDLGLFGRERLAGGRLEVRAYTYSSGAAPIGFTELNLRVGAGRASGFVRMTSTTPSGAKCDSGVRPFTARHT